MTRRRGRRSRLLEQVQETLIILVVGIVVVMVVSEQVLVDGVKVPLEKILVYALQGSVVLALLYLAYSMRTLPDLIKQVRTHSSKKGNQRTDRVGYQSHIRKSGPLFRDSQQSPYKKFWRE